MVSSIIWTFYSSVKFSRYNLSGGDERNRTADPLLARQVLSQLSYTPIGSLFALCLSSSLLRALKIKQCSTGLLPYTQVPLLTGVVELPLRAARVSIERR